MTNDIILYTTDDGKASIELHLDNGTVWLNQLELAELFRLPSRISASILRLFLRMGNLMKSGCQLSVDNHSTRAMAGKPRAERLLTTIWI